jgi:hypothetical protein
MSNYNECIESAGQEYVKWYYENTPYSKNPKPQPLTRGEFIEKLRVDNDFYKKWGKDCMGVDRKNKEFDI